MHALHERRLHPRRVRRAPAPRLLLPVAPPPGRPTGTAAATSCPTNFSEMPRAAARAARRARSCSPRRARPTAHGYFTLGTNADYVAPLIGTVPFFLEVNAAHAADVRAQPDPRLARSLGWTRGRPAARGGRRRSRPTSATSAIAGSSSPSDPRRRDDPGRHRRHPQRGPGLPARPPRPRHPHRAALRRRRSTSSSAAWSPARASSCARNKVVATFALGTQRLYDWLHDNGVVEMLPRRLRQRPAA